MGINPRAYGRPAEGQLFQTDGSGPDALDAEFNLARIAAKLLPQTDRRSIGQVGPADLHDAIKFFCFALERRVKRFQGR
jgi:hypothetical protein